MRSAVIGAGAIADQHLRFLRDRPRVQLVAIADISRAMASDAADRFSVPAAYTDYQDLLASQRPDVVHVCTPPRTHAQIVSDALRAGCHVIVEKPAALSADELDELLAIAERHGRVLVEDHNYRFNRPVRELVTLVRSGVLGQLREVSVRFASPQHTERTRYNDAVLISPSHELPAGFIHEYLTHLACLLLLFLGDEPWEAGSTWRTLGTPVLSPADDLTATVWTARSVGFLRFSAVTSPSSLDIALSGALGWATAEVLSGSVRLAHPRRIGSQLTPFVNDFANGWRGMTSSARALGSKLVGEGGYEGMQCFLGATYDALRDGSRVPVTPEEMRAVARLIDELVGGLGCASS